jgi:hypothetical protein
MKPKKNLRDFERLAPPPSSPAEQPAKTSLALHVLFDNGDRIEYEIGAALRQELTTRLTPSLDKSTPTFVSFTEAKGNDLVILNTAHIFSIEIGRS